MKSPITLLIAIAVFMFNLSSCKNKKSPVVVTDNAITGSWKVTNLLHHNKDETSNFSSFTFSFTDQGEVNAVIATETIPGTYSIHDSYAGDTKYEAGQFAFSFPNNTSLSEITKDWHIVSKTDSTFKLCIFDAGFQVTDSLTIGKIN